MTGSIPDVLADPVGVAVGLITSVEPGLDWKAAEAAIRSVALAAGPSSASSPRPSPGGLWFSPTAGRPHRAWPGTC